MSADNPLARSSNGLGEDWPAWIREFESTLAVHSQYVFHGNIRDRYIVPSSAAKLKLKLMSFTGVLWEVLRSNGYECLVTYDTVDGISVYPAHGDEAGAACLAATAALGGEKSVNALNKATAGVNAGEDAVRERFSHLRACIEAVAGSAEHRAAFVIDYASRLARESGDLATEERAFFLACAKLAGTARRWPGAPGREHLHNPVIWVVDGERDLPPWLTAGSPLIRTIGVPAPDLDARQQAARLLSARFGVEDPDGDEEAKEAAKTFAVQSDGLSLHQMSEIALLARDRQLGYRQLPEAIHTYKFGVVEDPWRRTNLRGRIRAGEQGMFRRVIGQQDAVTQTMDILKRASLGLSGAQASSSRTRPRGVLFFAGPTGVGKTELAKAVAALIFGDHGGDSAFLRFDMSEFSAEHSADRLIGAPPGYVGFEAGGELTNAVRLNPFRVILFDEIEKANGRILDKFLQIIEDGRLTDGRGQTTYFSECIIIFTSNLGILGPEDKQTKRRELLVTPDEPYAVVAERVLEGVTRHFIEDLGRPELRNRLGGNIVVFDFIRPDVATAIFDKVLRNILRVVSDVLDLTIHVDPDPWQALSRCCTGDPLNGARGIGNHLESLFINPIARELFDREPAPGSVITVVGFDPEKKTLTLR
jgi:ATP-dependent Clp protease ATP-binding subunit ClpB